MKSIEDGSTNSDNEEIQLSGKATSVNTELVNMAIVGKPVGPCNNSTKAKNYSVAFLYNIRFPYRIYGSRSEKNVCLRRK